jgi:predicted GIY-YIG superfamily endonuclease
MSHLHTLQIRPQIYTDLLQGDKHRPYYLYVGASEDSVRRFTQHQLAYDAYHSAAGNDGWSTPDFTRKHHRVRMTVQLQFTDGGQDCAAQELDTFMQWFHLHDCSLEVVRGADWCRPVLSWGDRKCYGRGRYGPTLRQAYDDWVASGRAAQVDSKRDLFLGWLQANL